MGKGALSGATGALVAEIVAEALPEDMARHDRGEAGKLAGATAGFLTGGDVESVNTAIQTSSIAIENNFWHMPIIATVVIVDKVAGVVMTAKEFYDTYQEEGLDAALQELAIKGGTRLAFGSGGRFVLKLTKTIKAKYLLHQAKQKKLPAPKASPVQAVKPTPTPQKPSTATGASHQHSNKLKGSDTPKNVAQYEQYKAELRRNMEKPVVQDERLGKLVDKLFKGHPNPVGNGSTQAALRKEKLTGELVHGKDHYLKSSQYVEALERWQRAVPNASASDKHVAEQLLKDLKDALNP